ENSGANIEIRTPKQREDEGSSGIQTKQTKTHETNRSEVGKSIEKEETESIKPEEVTGEAYLVVSDLDAEVNLFALPDARKVKATLSQGVVVKRLSLYEKKFNHKLQGYLVKVI